MLKNV